MGVVEVRMVPAILHRLLKLCVIGFLFTVQGSAGYSVSPSPAAFPEFPPPEGTYGPLQPIGSFDNNAPHSGSQPNGPHLNPPVAPPPLPSAPAAQDVTGFVPSLSPIGLIVPPPLISEGNVPFLSPGTLAVSPSFSTAPPPLNAQGHTPPIPSISPEAKKPIPKAPVLVPITPVATPASNLPPNSSVIEPSTPSSSPPNSSNLPPNSSVIHPSTPPNSHQSNTSHHGVPVPVAVSPVSSPPKKSEQIAPVINQIAPPPMFSTVPVVSPIGGSPQNSSANHPLIPRKSPITSSGPSMSHPSTSTPSPNIYPKEGAIPVAASPVEPLPVNHSPTNGSSAVAPSTHQSIRHSVAPVSSHSPTESPISKGYHSPMSLPSVPFDKHNHSRNRVGVPATAPSNLISHSPKEQVSVIPPSLLPTRQTHDAGPPLIPGPSSATSHSDLPTPANGMIFTPSPSPVASSGRGRMPVHSPKVSPPGSSSSSPKMPLQPPILALPPPPPNEDCSSTVCMDPYTNSPPGSPCACVLPMQVGLRLSVALYTFFPLVSELALEIAGGVFMKQSQVRIIGANAASQQPEKTTVLVDLVPLGERFDNTTAFLTFQRFWHKQVLIKASYFGDYDVLYVHYPGLPPPPPMAPSGIDMADDGPYSGNNNDARTIKPIGVDIQKRQHRNQLGAGLIAITALSAFVGLVLFAAVAWVLWFRKRQHTSQPATSQQALPPSVTKPSGTAGSVIGSGLSSASLSFGSSIATYKGSAKTFSTSDIERATNNFDNSSILGEGGFGRVYSGVLDDGTKVAVKVLKRVDQQGGREFLAEVEMLSRLHHRNLVKLIGICTEERSRCLVYELIPNGSVESHLHGFDKDAAPLDWDARIKIALGAARGLAYLHEDSSPRVIHRDFKSSNILLEHDFTPKVSDFGLARTAMDEENRHISTRVMGTFGYVAPEYAMTGHLLVKSDVYSYGVVLLELLTGRKPVDMSQPPGRENLVAWARLLLTSREGLEEIIDPSLGPDVPFDSVAKVAAIASMCVQPEVSHRPFMGEVVQALKLVCNECDEAKEVHSNSSSHELSIDMDAGVSAASGQLHEPFRDQNLVPQYDSEPDIERGLSMSDMFSSSVRYSRQASGSFRRYSSSGPLTTRRGRNLWQKIRRLRRGSVSEHGIIFKLWPGSH